MTVANFNGRPGENRTCNASGLVLSHEDPDKSIQQVAEEFSAIYEVKDDGKYLQVRDEQGSWIFRSKRMIAQNPDLLAPSGLPKDG